MTLKVAPQLRQLFRLEAREVVRNDEILVATGGFARVTSVGFRDGKLLIETETGEKTLIAPDAMIAVKR
jgi:preprotein translocase subunit YajC